MLKRKIAGFLFIFIAGFLFMFTILSYSDWKYEDELIEHLSAEVIKRCDGSSNLSCIADTAMYYTHIIQDPMMTLFGNKEFSSPKTILTGSSFSNFYFGKGACGAYASFFSRLMARIGYRSKFVILNVNGREGGHIATVVEQDDKLLLVDPLSGHIFRDSNGNMTEIDTVSKYWNSYYKHHLSANYNKSYNYQMGWKYTNWDKLGVMTKLVYKTTALFIGKEEADKLSLRYFVIRMNKAFVFMAAAGFIISVMIALRLFRPEVNALLEYLSNRKNQKNRSTQQ